MNYTFCVLLGVILLLSSRNVNGQNQTEGQGDLLLDYSSINCRAHSASLTDFGGVGDGTTMNTKAFNDAMEALAKYDADGGSLLYVPPGKWLTGSFNITRSHFTLFLDQGAVLLASQAESDFPIISPLPSYGRGRDAAGGRSISLIFGTNLTDVVITGNNGTIDGQGQPWWDKYRGEKLVYTRPYLIELLFTDQLLISNITLVNSPSWNVHPTYCTNVVIKGITISAPVRSPNTDGINPDSCTNVLIEDCYITSGDDCIAVKSGWDQYGIAFGMPTKQVVIRRLTCISPTSATIALGSEMFWNCTDIAGVSNGVTPKPCDLLPEKGPVACEFPTAPLPGSGPEVQIRSCKTNILKKQGLEQPKL